MRLWTTQEPGFAEMVRRRGRYRAAWSRLPELVTRRRLVSEFPGRWGMVDAYRWIVAQMEHRGVPTGGRPPVWAWHKVEGRRRPDFRKDGENDPYEAIALNVPDELVVLSDFDAWHSVLNRWYLAPTRAEDDRFDALQLPWRDRYVRVQQSWIHIFDLSFGDPSLYGHPDERTVQACLPYVDAAWIQSVRQLKGRRWNPYALP